MVKKYVLFSLDDYRTGRLAEALGNKTCKKILDLLAENELSESELSGKLNIPINTIDYNIKKLKNVGLIEEKSHLFSIKGKRIPIYKVSQKHIVISPKKMSEKIKAVKSLSLIVISTIFTGFILWYNKFRGLTGPEDSRMILAAEEVSKTSAITLGVLEFFLIGIWILIILVVVLSHIKFKDVRRSNENQKFS